MENVKKSRNYCIDFIKGIACIMVVFMHCEFPGKFGIFMQTIARFSVPFFFMVSGYFCYYNGEKARISKKIRHIGIIIIGGVVLYTGFAVIKKIFFNTSISVSLKQILEFIIFNNPFIIAGQLWFLFALLYDYIIYYFINKYNLQKKAYYLIPILFIIYIMLAQGAYILKISISNMIYRNWLIEGLPFFLLGHYIHYKQEKIKINNKILIGVLIVSTLLCIAERIILGRDFGVNISTIPQVISLLLIAVIMPLKNKDNKLCILGTYYSMYVYMLHPLVWHIFEYIYNFFKIDNNRIALYCMPVIVVIVTIIVSILFRKMNDKIKILRKCE